MTLTRRAYGSLQTATHWEELWEAGSYYERISEILEEAREYAIFAGWQVDSRLPFHRPCPSGGPSGLESLKEKVIRLCEAKPGFHVYFLMWDHAYFYVLEREQMQGRVWDEVHSRVHFVFDNRHPLGASHHEKAAIIDGKVAFCGGIDLCDERWDSPQHLYFDPRRSLDWKREHHGPYHDLAVQVDGPVCGSIQDHVARRWRALSSIPFPDPPRPGRVENGHSVYVSRTISGVDAGERGVPIIREIEFLVLDLIAKAERRIILEGQYYWSRRINDALMAKAIRMRGKPFEIVLVLADMAKLKKLTRQMATHELRLLQRLESACAHAGVKLTVGSPLAYDPAGPPKPIYVHSKVIVVDDRYLSIGSANLAARALRVDTEIQLTLEAKTEAERLHIRRVAEEILHHWGLKPSDSNRHIRLRAFQPRAELYRIRARSPWLSRLPWSWFFDPELPWLYFLKRRFRQLERTHAWGVRGLAASAWCLGALLTWRLAAWVSAPGALETSGPWLALYSAILSTAWLLPIPFTPVALLASLHLGAAIGAALAVSGLWVSALWGYTVTRMFPTFSGRFYRRTGPPWLPQRIGFRTFPYLVSVLADPRVSLRSKIAYQGLYCVPFPWFALGTMLVLPGAMTVLCRVAGELLSPEWAARSESVFPATALGLALAALARVIWIGSRHPLDVAGTHEEEKEPIWKSAA